MWQQSKIDKLFPWAFYNKKATQMVLDFKMQNAAMLLSLAEPITLVYASVMFLASSITDHPIVIVISLLGGGILWFVGYQKQVAGKNKLKGEARIEEEKAKQEAIRTQMLQVDLLKKVEEAKIIEIIDGEIVKRVQHETEKIIHPKKEDDE